MNAQQGRNGKLLHSLLLKKHSVEQGERLRKVAIYTYHILIPQKPALSVDLWNKVSSRSQKAFRCRTTLPFYCKQRYYGVEEEPRGYY